MQQQTLEVEVLPIYEAEKAAIDSQIATAKMYPRNRSRCIQNMIADATLTKEAAEKCVYSVPRGKKSIQGASAYLATIVLQNWGNIRAGSRIIKIDERRVTSHGVCIDLETNVGVDREIQRLIIDSDGDRFTEDMITVTSNAANSISMRNAVLAVIPKSITDTVMDAVKRKITGDVSTKDKLIKEKRKQFDAIMQTYNVTEQEILDSIGRQSFDDIDENDLVLLAGIKTALKDGDTTVDQAFRRKKATQQTVVMNPREERLIEQLKNCKNIPQLEALQRSVKTNKEREVYDEMSLKLKTDGNGATV